MKKIILSIILLGGVNANAQQLLEILRSVSNSDFTLPSGVNIENGKYIIASTYDTNYLPFSAPTQPATWDIDIHPDATPETKTLDYQGKITQEGVIVNIPITVTSVGTNPKIPAYTQTINIPAWKTQDGISRNLTLSWEEQTYDANTKYIKATLIPDGLLNVKKLDLNAGLGSDYQGVELGTFSYDYQYTDNSTKGTSKFEVRALSGIPDRHFGRQLNMKYNSYTNREFDNPYFFYNELDDNYGGGLYPYDLIYLPIEVNGKIWLNNNLGAAYSRVTHREFNPSQQAKSRDDVYAFGNMYQWQRPADGHEISYVPEGYDRTWLRQYRPIYRANILSDSWTPNHNAYIAIYGDPVWVLENSSDYNISNLWQAGGSNNPCPIGFHVPTFDELKENFTDNNFQNFNNAEKLKLPDVGIIDHGSGYTETGYIGYYWSSSRTSTQYVAYGLFSNGLQNIRIGGYRHYTGGAIRCIQD